MSIAIWIIAIAEIIRLVQNTFQLIAMKKARNDPYLEKATDAFVANLNKSDEEWLNNMLQKMKEYPFALDLEKEQK